MYSNTSTCVLYIKVMKYFLLFLLLHLNNSKVQKRKKKMPKVEPKQMFANN